MVPDPNVYVGAGLQEHLLKKSKVYDGKIHMVPETVLILITSGLEGTTTPVNWSNNYFENLFVLSGN
jgi:catalase (peroxidase I)